MKYLYSTLIILTTLALSSASMSSGTIDPLYKTTKICQEVTCSNVSAYTLNMAPSGVTQVTIDDINGVDGVGWGSSIGWVTFDPTGPEGVTINPNTGILSGKAWAQSSGWVNFSVTNHQVAINNNGEFIGWAWTGGVGGGWVKFDCADVSACIKTDWRPIPARSTTTPVVTPTVSTGGGIISSYTDVCPNLPDQQYNVPSGYGLNSGVCSPIDDKCINLAGSQSIVPTGYNVDTGGLCVLKSLDMCPNISGNQSVVPVGQTINAQGNCMIQKVEDEVLPKLGEDQVGTTLSEIDMCSNILGLQVSIPTGMIRDSDDSCVPVKLDYCPNIALNQVEVPADLVIDSKGNCISGLTKLDSNPVTINNSINVGDNRYVLPLTPSVNESEPNLITYSFIPDSLKIGVKADIIADLFVSDEEEANLGGELPKVDITSIVVTISLLFLVGLRIIRMFLI